MKSEMKEKFRIGHGPGFGKGILQDVRFSLRMLRKNIGFSVIAILMLAVGVEGNFVNFSIYNAVFLRPLPFPGGDRFVNLDEAAPLWNLEYTGLRYSDFYSWREANRSFEAMTAFKYTSRNLSFEGALEHVWGIEATYDIVPMLGIKPVLGRAISPDDDRPGGAKVIVLSSRLWTRQFGGSEDVVGKTLKLDNEIYTIIGVVPDMDIVEENDFWIPLQLDPNNLSQPRNLTGFGRLKEGVDIKTAEEDLRLIQSGLIEKNQAIAGFTPVVTGFKDRYFGYFRLGFQVLYAAMCVVLLIVSGNMAALMLARGLSRSREFVIRCSLGATAQRLARLICVESLMIAVLGGLVGLLLGRWNLQIVLNTIMEFWDKPEWFNLGMDWRVCLFSGLVIVIPVLLGALPVVCCIFKLELHDTLKSSSRQSTTTAPGRRGLRFLIVAELALTLILMIQSGLLVQTFRSILNEDPGFRSDNILIYKIDLPEKKYGSAEAQTAFFKEHLEGVRTLPGVISAGAINRPPLCLNNEGTSYSTENAPPKKAGESQPNVLRRIVFPGYFKTMEIPILAGRSFTKQDGLNQGSMAVIVDKAFADRSWPNDNPIGKRIREDDPQGFLNLPWLTVVGVAKDVKHVALDYTGHPGVYLPFPQEPREEMSIVLRTSVAPESLVPAVRALVRESDPDLPVFHAETMAERLTRTLAIKRLQVITFGVFAVIALLMAIGGIYGVFSYAVTRRTQEIGVRMALGARRSDVLRMVLKENLFLVLIGIGIGLAGALVMSPLTAGLLFGTSPFDPSIFVGISLLLTAVSMLACWLPARRAMGIQPMEALRCE